MNTALLALALLAPADTPVTPIDRTTVEATLQSPEAIGLCLDIADQADVVRLLGDLGAGDAFIIMFLDMELAYWADAYEGGAGDGYTMTVEARDTFDVWVKGCQGR